MCVCGGGGGLLGIVRQQSGILVNAGVFLGLSLVDILVTHCQLDCADVRGEAQWEVCQQGSSGAEQFWCQR